MLYSCTHINSGRQGVNWRRCWSVSYISASGRLVGLQVLAVVSSGVASVAVARCGVQFNKTQLDKHVDSGVDVHRAQLVLTHQLGRHEALDDVVAAAAEPASATFRCRE